MIKSIRKRYNWLTKVFFDKHTGFYYYMRYGEKIYIRYPRHYLPEKDIRWLCENIIYHYYTPKANEQVVDLGAGYGDEAIFLKKVSPSIKYLAVEAQPVIYECLSNTFSHLGDQYRASPFVISTEKDVRFVSQYSYAAVGSVEKGYIEIPTLTWVEFVARYNIDNIDLLKMNIEGAEKNLISSIDDFSMIKRLIISCHDFRANNGDGEFFRSKEIVLKKLQENNYKIQSFNFGIRWADDWIFAINRESL